MTRTESNSGGARTGERTRREALRLLGGTAALVAAGTGAGAGSAVAQSDGESFTVEDIEIESWDGTMLAVSIYEPNSGGPHPAMLMTHGYGADRSSVDPWASMYAKNGYVVLTYDSRGFGESGGEVNVDGPKEIKDAQRLITYLAEDVASVENDGPQNPRVGMDGLSYAGGIQLNTAAAEGAGEGLPESDDRIDAIVPRWAWWDLTYSLAPNSVYKSGWQTLLLEFGAEGSRDQGSIEDRLGGQDSQLYQFYLEGQATGDLSAEARTYFEKRSPRYDTGLGSLDDITTPSLFIQGWPDTLFVPNEPVYNARDLEANDVPTRFVFFEGGHTATRMAGDRQKSYNDGRALRWIDEHVGDGPPADLPKVSFYEVQSEDFRTVDGFPPSDAEERTLSLGDAANRESGSTTVTDLDSRSGAAFDYPIDRETEVFGIPHLSAEIEPIGAKENLLFGLYRVKPDGTEIGPFDNQLAATEVAESGRIELDLIGVQRRIEPCETLRLRVATVQDGNSIAGFRPEPLGAGATIHHSAERPASLTVPARASGPGVVGPQGEPAADPDTDGEYEDVTGDCEADVVDVQRLFANREGEAVGTDPGAFDFNEDGEFDVVDVQRLFREVS
jgi:predicted acyl esterase